MRFLSTLPYVALATSFVLPDIETFSKLGIEQKHSHDDVSTWDDETIDNVFGPAKQTVPKLDRDFRTEFELALEDEELIDAADCPGHHHGRHCHHGRRTSNLTIYQLISKSEHTTKFTKLVDEYDDIVQLLNSTKANYTLFVPVNSAFAHIPDHGDKKPSKEFLEKVLKYHIGLDVIRGHDFLTTQTVPTALDEDFGPQRLRTSVTLRGARVNFFTRVVHANINAKNGVIHAVDHILVPPPYIGRELNLLPTVFSTLLLAYEKTDFVSFLHGLEVNGTTLFAPTNRAWARLGPGANAFLFNTEKGKGFLKALLKYQIVPNTTLYSDALYTNTASSDEIEADGYGSSHHFDLTTLLHGLPIAVDVSKWGPIVKFVVNRYIHVVVRDGIAKNGVIQVVDKVPFPPHKHHHREVAWDGEEEIDVEDLIERLADYVDDEEGKGKSRDWSDL